MTEILFDELKPILNYFPVKVGKAEMRFNGSNFQLSYDNLQWCTLNTKYPFTNLELKEQFLELNLAKGRVVTTGLGFGMIQCILSQRNDVSEVVVYEKYEDIIKMFLLFAKTCNFDTSKIKIVNEDAINCTRENCDWLVMDHFEGVHQVDWEIVDFVREISDNCNATNVLFWSMHRMYIDFCHRKTLEFNNESYSKFRKQIKIEKFPEKLDDRLFDKLHYFVWANQMYQLSLTQQMSRSIASASSSIKFGSARRTKPTHL